MQSEKMIRDSELVLENIVLEENNVKEPVQKTEEQSSNKDKTNADSFWYCFFPNANCCKDCSCECDCDCDD